MRVLLIQMPFFTLDTASISLSMVKAALDRAGVPCDIKYFNLEFADRLGIDLYSWIAGDSPPYLLFGDLIFAPSLHASHISQERLKRLIEPLGTPGVPQVPENIVEAYPELVEAAGEFLRGKLMETNWSNYDLVGFSTMFQIAPPLAMARLIKTLEKPPDIIFGGSYCEGEMGEYLLRSFPSIDYVCRGEGENLIVQLIESLSAGSTALGHIAGLVWRGPGGVQCNGEKAYLRAPNPRGTISLPQEYELDVLPQPTYHDWLEQVKEYRLIEDDRLRLPIETSRGCWYGEKQHCTFCGLNGSTIAYRRKSAKRALEEYRDLMSYGVKLVHSVDDILDFRYFKTLLPDLALLGHGFEIFYEIKANLTRDQVQLLHDSGIVWIQPGIESLSTPILKLMGKGVSALQNIRLLRYTAECCIGTAWNLLYGFPGENPQDFLDMAKILPKLSHLQPPYISCCQVRIHRFSPLFIKRDTVGLIGVEPTPSYYEIFPFERDIVARLAYYFDHDYLDGRNPNSYIASCANAVLQWHAEVGRAAFISFDRDNTLHLIDTREVAMEARARLNGLERDIYVACLHGVGIEQLLASTGRSEAEIRPLLEDFLQRSWLLYVDGRYLSLAVPMDHHVPPYVPLALVEETLVQMYLGQMDRIHQGFVESTPSLKRLREGARVWAADPVAK